MPSEQEFLLYPLDTGEDPACLSCGTLMMVAGHEVRETKPDFITFRCKGCGRSEKYVCGEWRTAGPPVTPAGFSWSFGQVKMPSLLALHASDRAISGFFVSLAVQRHADGEAARRVLTNDLDAAYRFASRPLANGFEALLSKRPIAHSNSSWIRHVGI
jgi:hypothetical protein